MSVTWLQRAFLALIALASLYTSTQYLVSLGNLSRADAIAASLERVTPLKKSLPFRRGVVGYVWDGLVPDPVPTGSFRRPGNSFGDKLCSPIELGQYMRAQYAMAPIILILGTDAEWSIGNLSSQAYAAWSASNHGAFKVFSFGDGLYLFHRTRK